MLAGTAAAAPSPLFRVLTLDHGLPSNTVNGLVQDRAGYLWIASNDGLARFDGVEFTIFRNDGAVDTSIPGNSIQTVFADSKDRIWVAAEGEGLAYLDQSRRHFSRYRYAEGDPGPAAMAGADVWTITEDQAGYIWVGLYRAGVQRLDVEQGLFSPFPAEQDLRAETVFTLATDASDRLWVATIGGGLVIVEANRTDFRRYRHQPDAPDSLPSDVVVALLPDAPGGARVATRKAVGVFNPDSGRFTVLPSEPDLQVNALTQGGHGRSWLGTTRGISLLAPDLSGTVRSFRAKPAVPDSLPGNQVNAVLEDREGQVWVGTAGDGLARLPPDWENFAVYRHDPLDQGSVRPELRAVHADGDSVWVGGGPHWLDRIDLESGRVTRLEWPDSIPTGRLQSIAGGTDTELWVGVSGGLVRFDPATEEARWYPVDSAGRPPATVSVAHIGRDLGGALWLGVSEVGLQRFDPGTETMSDWSKRVSGEFIHQVQADSDGRMWVASDRGLDRYNPRGDRFEPLVDDPIHVLAFAFGAADTVWVAALNGLNRYRLDGDRLVLEQTLTQAIGLPEIRFGGVRVDALGALWLTSRRGLYRYDPNSGMVQHFTRRDGLPGVEFRERPLAIGPDGRCYGLTRAGLVIFDPLEVTVSGSPPPVYITRITVASQPLTKPALHWAPIEVDYRASDISLEFAALSLVDPERNEYAYMLENVDPAWVYAGNRRSRSYNNLPPGNYRFRVKAADSRGYWNEQGAAVDLRVLPPPWRTPWAAAVYAITFVGLIVAAVAAYRARLRRRHELERARERQSWAETQRDMTLSLTSTLDIEEILGRLLEGLSEVVSSDKSVVSIDREGLPRCQVQRGFEAKDLPNFREVRREIQRFSKSSQAEPMTLSAMGALGQTITVPVVAGEEVFGIVTLIRRAGEMYVERDRLMAGSYARQAGIALENARLFREVRKLADEAESASRAKSDFLAKMSHEIRTPMNGVLGMTELLLETDLNASQRNYAQAVEDSGKVLLNIINDILDLSKIEAGKLDLERIDIQLGQLMEETVKLFTPSAAKKGLEFGYVIHPEVPRHLIGDPVRIRQVLMNLIDNALKFTDHGRVRIDVTPGSGDTIRFVVKDTGIGMDAEGYAQLFQPFTQAEESTSRRYGGTGLGLAICKQLVEKMGGAIEAVTKAGHGSLFWFELPQESVPGAVAPRLPGSEWLESGFVLIAMRSSVARDSLIASLKQYGVAAVVSTATPDEPLPRERPALVLAQPRAWNPALAAGLADRERPLPLIWVVRVDDKALPELPDGLRLGARPLPEPVFESELMLRLIEVTDARSSSMS